MPRTARPIPPADFDDPLRPRNPLVSRRWLLGGVGIVILGAFLALYFAVGLLFWQGEWQLIFHPSHIVARTPASSGIAYEEVRFDATEAGQTRLTGWWIPGAESQGKPALLYLHEARGSLSDALPDLAALHALGYDIFAFDPRGFGKSQWAKPSEHHWNRDAEAALYYLASVRHIGPSHVVVAGRGLGATVAANLTLRRPGIRSLVMIDPQPPTLGLLRAPRWTHILPIRLLARDRFNPAKALASESVNKLIILPPSSSAPGYVAHAAAPVTVIHGATAAGALHGIDLAAPEIIAALQQSIPASRTKGSN